MILYTTHVYLLDSVHMTEKQKADMIRKELLAYASWWDVATFLIDETQMFFQSLNCWKLEKLKANKTLFKRFVFLLDDQHAKQIHYPLRDRYYMSKRAYDALSKKSWKEPISQARIVQVASKIKAMFVFQAVEFCNGSLDRMNVIDFSRIRASIVRKLQPQGK